MGAQLDQWYLVLEWFFYCFGFFYPSSYLVLLVCLDWFHQLGNTWKGGESFDKSVPIQVGTSRSVQHIQLSASKLLQCKLAGMPWCKSFNLAWGIIALQYRQLIFGYPITLAITEKVHSLLGIKPFGYSIYGKSKILTDLLSVCYYIVLLSGSQTHCM